MSNDEVFGGLLLRETVYRKVGNIQGKHFEREGIRAWCWEAVLIWEALLEFRTTCYVWGLCKYSGYPRMYRINV